MKLSHRAWLQKPSTEVCALLVSVYRNIRASNTSLRDNSQSGRAGEGTDWERYRDPSRVQRMFSISIRAVTKNLHVTKVG